MWLLRLLGLSVAGGVVLGVGLRMWDIYWEKQKR